MSPPVPEADRAEELAVAASGTANEVETLPPDTGGVDEPGPAPVEEAATTPVEEAIPIETEGPEPVVIEETPPIEPAEPEEPAPVQEAAPLEFETADGEVIPLPAPPKPGTLAAALIEESALPALDEPAATEAPPPETEPSAAIEELEELAPETLALIDEILQQDREPEAPSAPVQTEDADPVPLPPYKPVTLARAEPAREAPAVSAPESQNISGSRAWRYVQLGTANARGPLEMLWETLRRRHDDALVGLSPLIMPVDRGDNGIFYRLRAGPLTNDAAAHRVCERLKALGRECFVARD